MGFGVNPFPCGIWELPPVELPLPFPEGCGVFADGFFVCFIRKVTNCKINQKYRLLSSLSLPNGNPEDPA